MANSSKRLVVFLFLCLTNSFQFFTVSSSASPRGYQEYAAARTLNQEQGNAHDVHCSRERSRAAWKIIEEKEQYQILTSCRLHPENDLYRDQEQHKLHEDINEWRCGYCKKTFYEEKYLDKHFDNRHYDLLNMSQGRCLADVCGALHCDQVMDSATRKTKCNPAAAARNKHLCESLAQGCFPVNEGPSAHRLNEFFLRQFCDAHTCTGRQKPFSKGGKVNCCSFGLGIKRGTQGLKRLSKSGQKKKSS
ncbi:hypothetical protein P3X46_032609 [Hevea brasiliensis]|uniref:C2H2-type domain-containing protein n=1 Tax=Hevea brasiliensis TaxID=3981 RepID=A0ABQ9KDU4_HEVBR|nr:hypothetical protein P3X46_032609 [Hevea brasiliensis]